MSSPVPEIGADQVLSTLNEDGSRRWIRPRLSRGRYYRARLITAWALIALFTALPYIRIRGKPAMLFDIPRREFTLFGATFLPTDTMLLMLLLVGIFVGVFLLTAVLGRVWCGWACPQTVYMEFVYRPLERLFEGDRRSQLALDRSGPNLRRVLKNVAFVLVSMFLAHTFLAYFVGVEALFRWIRQSPLEHPAAFLVMAGTAGLMFLDFAWFREQTCTLVCPYGRFQSVLLDRRSLIIGYDEARGEPRGRAAQRKKAAAAGQGEAHGDCIDCGACVITCPTGIDIRDGLQMECVACTQCIDACDQIMDRIGKPRGLIRYSSQAQLAREPRRRLRPRLILYPALLVVIVAALGVSLAGRQSADVTLLRGIGSPFTVLPSGEIANSIRVKVVNRTDRDREYRFELLGLDEGTLVAPENPLPVPAGRPVTTAVFVHAPRPVLPGGVREIRLRVFDGETFDRALPYRILGPTGPAPPSTLEEGEGPPP